ncbi:MAG: DUF433 domain-containing protein [Candidatus Magasanikbacteria bacterium]|nr:DUF433 domain-containing protein [Candidatus Magasanikbacteria bacterium]
MVGILSKRIITDLDILGSKPIIKGTRISVEFILELVRSGMSFSDILQEYPDLTRADLEAAMAFAKHAVSREEIVPFKFAAHPS